MPRHAGTFGPEEVFQKAPPEGHANLSPAEGYQFFGRVDQNGESETLTVTQIDSSGQTLHQQILELQRG